VPAPNVRRGAWYRNRIIDYIQEEEEEEESPFSSFSRRRAATADPQIAQPSFLPSF
jgi:hypothetical protein